MKKLKVYIAGPMTGYKDFNYPAFFEAEEMLKDKYIVLNPAMREPRQMDYSSYIRKGIELLLQAEVVYLLPGWERSTGARLEWEIARTLQLRIIYP